jgi:hypothetical protein
MALRLMSAGKVHFGAGPKNACAKTSYTYAIKTVHSIISTAEDAET